MAHLSRAYSGFCSAKWLGLFLLPRWDAFCPVYLKPNVIMSVVTYVNVHSAVLLRAFDALLRMCSNLISYLTDQKPFSIDLVRRCENSNTNSEEQLSRS